MDAEDEQRERERERERVANELDCEVGDYH
jgi:hypothetical protein